MPRVHVTSQRSLSPCALADSASCCCRFGAAGVKNAKRVATASVAAASRRSALRPVHAARGARLLCAAGGAVGATDVKNAFELLQKGYVPEAPAVGLQSVALTHLRRRHAARRTWTCARPRSSVQAMPRARSTAR